RRERAAIARASATSAPMSTRIGVGTTPTMRVMVVTSGEELKAGAAPLARRTGWLELLVLDARPELGVAEIKAGEAGIVDPRGADLSGARRDALAPALLGERPGHDGRRAGSHSGRHARGRGRDGRRRGARGFARGSCRARRFDLARLALGHVGVGWLVGAFLRVAGAGAAVASGLACAASVADPLLDVRLERCSALAGGVCVVCVDSAAPWPVSLRCGRGSEVGCEGSLVWAGADASREPRV